jgi:hypothetical protein
MLKKFVNLISRFKKDYIKVISIILLLALIGLSVVGDYGITYDEESPLRVAFENFKIVTEGKPYPGHLKHYGMLFNTVAEVVFQKNQQVFKPEFPLLSIQLGSTIYDEARQFLYILPGVAVISATMLAWFYQAIWGYRMRLLAVALGITLASPIVFDMVALHPYEYLYFNRTFGGLAKAQGQVETDYWALSMREGIGWINHHAEPNAVVVSSDPIYAAAPFAALGVTVIADEPLKTTVLAKPFYYVAIPRWDLQQRYSECEVVHQVVRQGAPLTLVKKCS